MAVKYGKDCAGGGNAHITGQAAHQQFADLPRTPVRLVTLTAQDHLLDLHRRLIGITHRPARAIGERLQPVFLVTIEDLVTGFSGNPELPANLTHAFALKQTGNKSKSFLHNRTLFPRHQHLLPNGKKCYLCVRYDSSPMSRVAHLTLKCKRLRHPCFVKVNAAASLRPKDKAVLISVLHNRLWCGLAEFCHILVEYEMSNLDVTSASN